MTRHSVATVVLTTLGLFACSAAPPPAPTPAPVATVALPSAPPVAGIAGGPAAPAPATPLSSDVGHEPAPPPSAAAATDAAAPVAAEPKFFPIDVVTGREMAYLIDYAQSGASEVAKKACSGKNEEDANKKAECLAKARDKFVADVLRFKKDDKGRVKLTIYRRSGSALAELFSGNVQLKEISPNLVKVELKGGSGQRPILRDRAAFDMKVPNGYSIELDDAVYGPLLYEAKVGLVAN